MPSRRSTRSIRALFCARETAQAVAKRHPHAHLIIDDDLIETHLGAADGLTAEEFQKIQTSRAYDAPHFASGESPREVHERLIRAIDRVVRENPDRTALVVCHGGIKRLIIMHLRDHTWDDVADMRFGNTSVSIFSVAKGQKAIEELFNCTRHLGDDDGLAGWTR